MSVWRNKAPSARWDDLRAPATGINLPGALASPSAGLDGSLLFSNVTENNIAVLMQLPHSWKEGSEVRPHVHWSKTTDGAGDVVWEIRYRVIPIHGLPPAWTAWTAATSRSQDPGSTQKHVLDAFPAIDLTGAALSAMLSFQIRRNPAAVALWEFDLHYLVDSLGSRQEYVK